MPLFEMCAECKNFFSTENDRHKGTFTVKDGAFAPLDFLQDGQYFRVVGSTFNDGVYQYPEANLTDETFTGEVWAMRVPPAFIERSDRIDAWTAKHAETLKTPYTSESFAGYSYTIAQNQSAMQIFSRELNKWRKL